MDRGEFALALKLTIIAQRDEERRRRRIDGWAVGE
jgi:hypothetical protein